MYTICFFSPLECHKRVTGCAGTVACPDTESQDSLSSPKSWVHSTPQHKRNCLCCKQAGKSILAAVHLDEGFMIKMFFSCWSTHCPKNKQRLRPVNTHHYPLNIIVILVKWDTGKCFGGVTYIYTIMLRSPSSSTLWDKQDRLCLTQEMVSHHWGRKLKAWKH